MLKASDVEGRAARARSGEEAASAPGPVEFVQGSPADLEDVLTIERLSFAAPWSPQFFLQELADRHSYLFLARLPGELRPVGFICFWLLGPDVHILNIAVHPGFRRRGIGRGLLDFALEYGRARGARQALLEVRCSNDPAIALYEHLGFRLTRIRRAYYMPEREDALEMRLEF